MKLIKSNNPETHDAYELDYYGQTVEIDVEIAPLIQELWRAGFRTDYSCQGKSNYKKKDSIGFAYIAFTYIHEFNEFLKIVYNNCNSRLKKRFETLWQHEIFLAPLIFENRFTGVGGIIRFPQSDIEHLTKILKNYNKKYNKQEPKLEHVCKIKALSSKTFSIDEIIYNS